MAKVFIDGSAGTTGLRIHERLAGRNDIDLLLLSEDRRKDSDARCEMLNLADIVFLCLPDVAAIEAVNMIENKKTAVIDTSTAHRTNPSWVYGFPELTGNREKISNSKRIANPGCHASGFVALIAPLVEKGIIEKDVLLSAFSLTGYSGGGKKMIAEYEADDFDALYAAPRMYGIGQNHKHMPEITNVCKIDSPPVFCPIVAPYYSGMEVTVPIHTKMLNGSVDDVKNVYREYYAEGLVRFSDEADENGFMSACAYKDRDDMQIAVCGNSDRIVLVSRFDNLGKGASGAAIQNMNILLGVDEKTALNI